MAEKVPQENTACLDPRREKCKCTASNLADAIASLGYNSQIGYAKRILGQSEPVAMNEYMQQGIDMEAEVAEAFNCFTGLEVELCGFDTLELDERFGASGDYRVVGGKRDLVEIKTTSRRDGYRRSAMPIPINHLLQMLGQIAVFKAEACWYVGYDVNRREYYIARVTFDSVLWDEHIYPRVRLFMNMMDKKQLPPPRVPTALKLAVTNIVLEHTHVSTNFSDLQ